MLDFDYHRPRSLGEAQELKATIAGARYVAGGTDLLVRIKNRTERPPALISLRHIAELSGIEARGDALRIGAATPLADVLHHPEVAKRGSVLTQAVRRMGSVQIRNSATMGGNLCNASPCADTATPLLVLGATLEVRGPAGTRHVPIGQWFTGPGETVLGEHELLSAVLLGPQPPAARGAFLKKGRVRMDLSLVNVAAQVVLAGDGQSCAAVALAAGAVAPVPLLLERSAQLLHRKPLEPELIAQAAALAMEDVQPIGDTRATAAYRRHLVGVFVRRALASLAEGGAA